MARSANMTVRPRGRRDTPERMIRRFTKKVKKAGIIDEARNRRHYEKPSVKRRRKQHARKRAIERAIAKEKAKKQTNYRSNR